VFLCEAAPALGLPTEAGRDARVYLKLDPAVES
jgi:hypothetical protein